ncbi:hypothetical protein NBRC116589_12260 [Ruegeria sp. HU-ET01832]
MLAVGRHFTMIERWEDAMLRLNVLALFPEFARAIASVVIQLSHVVGGLGSQSKIALPAPPRDKLLEREITGSKYVP